VTRMRQTMLIRLGFLLLLGGGMWLAYTQAPAPSKLNTIKLAEDLYVIHNDYVPGNTTAMVTNDGVILVDDKFPFDADNIVSEVKKITNQPIKYVVNTHHHGDHSGGNQRLQQLGAQVVSSERARQNMVDGKQTGQSNVTFENRMNLYLGGKRVELHYFGRSHTNCDITAYFPAQRVIAAGDMFTFGDATPLLVDYSGGGSAKDWTSTVDGALKLDFDRVVPGHGDVTTKAEMQKFRGITVSLRSKVHEMMVTKKSKAEIEKMLRADFHFADLHIQRSLDGLMAELQ
jgi:cyclase